MADGQLSLFEDNNPPRWVPDGRRLVYFIECHPFIKIGFTQRAPETRRSEFKTGNPHQMRIIGAIVVPDGEDDHIYHRMFARWHSHDEWFHDTPELRHGIVRLINSQRTTAPALVSPPEIGKDSILNFDCPECRKSNILGARVTALQQGVFGRVNCGRCGIGVPLVWAGFST
jgi:hypothetical protein